LSARRLRPTLGFGLQILGLVLTPTGLLATLTAGGSVHAELLIMALGVGFFTLGRRLSA
jgi:hypothetical protein